MGSFFCLLNLLLLFFFYMTEDLSIEQKKLSMQQLSLICCQVQKNRFMKIVLIISLLVFSFGCRKTNLQNSCADLSLAVMNSDKALAKSAIDNMIRSLPSSQYTENNIKSLVNKISGNCNLQTIMICFDCIKTLPTQTEIRITINSGTTTVQKIIDLSYTSSNKMIFHNMHD